MFFKKIKFKIMLFKSFFVKKKFFAVGFNNKIFGKNITIIGNNVSIGSNCSINNFVTLRCGFKKIQIGDNVTISDFVYMTTSGLNLETFFKHKKIHKEGDIIIGDWVWFGARSVVLPGVVIGNNVVVAAGSVVTKNIPDNSVVAGVPAKVIKSY